MELKSTTLTLILAIILVVRTVKSSDELNLAALKERVAKMKLQAEGPTEPPSSKPGVFGEEAPVPSKFHVRVGEREELSARRQSKVEGTRQPTTLPLLKVVYPGQFYNDAWERYNLVKENGCTAAIKTIVPTSDHTGLSCPPVYKVDLGFTLTTTDPQEESAAKSLIVAFDQVIDALEHPYSYPLLHSHPRYSNLVKIAEQRLQSGVIYSAVGGQLLLNKLRDFLRRLDKLVVERDAELKAFEEMLFKKYGKRENFQLQLDLMPYRIYSRRPRGPFQSSDVLKIIIFDEEFLTTPLYSVKEIPVKSLRCYKEAEERYTGSIFYDDVQKKYGNREISAEEYAWYQKTKVFDKVVVDRYNAYEAHLKQIAEPVEPKDDWPFLTRREDLPEGYKPFGAPLAPPPPYLPEVQPPKYVPAQIPSALYGKVGYKVEKEENLPPKPIFVMPSKPVIVDYPPPKAQEKFVIRTLNGCSKAIEDIIPYAEVSSLKCPPVYEVNLGFKPSVDVPGQGAALASILREIDRDIDALGHSYSYPLLHFHSRYKLLVDFAKSRQAKGEFYTLVEGQTVLNELRDFLKKLDKFVVEQHAAFKEFEEMLLKKYKDETFVLNLEAMPYKIYSVGIITPSPPKEIEDVIREDERFLAAPTSKFMFLKMPKDMMQLHEKAAERLASWGLIVEKHGKKELSDDLYNWHTKLKMYDEMVVKRYETLEALKKASDTD